MTPNFSSLLIVKIASSSVFHHFEEGKSTKRYQYLRDEWQTVDTKYTRIVVTVYALSTIVSAQRFAV